MFESELFLKINICKTSEEKKYHHHRQEKKKKKKQNNKKDSLNVTHCILDWNQNELW